MALTTTQQELLHAWVDGETTAAENAAAEQLVAEETEARTYANELKRLRELVLTNACVAAPDGLRERICCAIKDEFERSTAPVIKLPGSVWRFAIMAAAAAVVVSLAFMYAPPMGEQHSGPQAEIASSTPLPSMGPGSEPFGGTWGDHDAGKFGHNDIRTQGPVAEETAKEPDEAAGKKFHEYGAVSSVLTLDRGVTEPFEVSVNMNRNRSGSTLQVYNDMLIVSSLYGSAHIADETAHDEQADDDATFSGNDFSNYDGVEVVIEPEKVPELLAALNRLTTEQNYGDMIVPADLRKTLNTTAGVVDELQDLNRSVAGMRQNSDLERAERPRADVPDGVRGYLPPDIQRDCVRLDARQLGKGEDKRVDDVLGREVLRAQLPVTDATESQPSDSASESRKVRLLIRLR